MHAVRLLRDITVVMLVLVETTCAWGAEQRVWTSADGKFKVLAELLDVKGEEIVIRKSDGTVISVPFAKLSEPDRAFAKQVMGGARRPPMPDAAVAFRGREPGTLRRANGLQLNGFLLELNAKKVKFHVQGQRTAYVLDAKDVAVVQTAKDTYTFDAAKRVFVRRGEERPKTSRDVGVEVTDDPIDLFGAQGAGRRADIEDVDGMRTRGHYAKFVGEALPLAAGQLTVRSKNYHVQIPMLLVRSIRLKDGAHEVTYSRKNRETSVVGDLYNGQFEFEETELGNITLSTKKLKSLVFIDLFEEDLNPGFSAIDPLPYLNAQAESRRKDYPRHEFTFVDNSQIAVYSWRAVGIPSPLERVPFNWGNGNKPFYRPAVKIDTGTYTVDFPAEADPTIEFGENRSVTVTFPSGKRIAGSLSRSYSSPVQGASIPPSVPFDGFEATSDSLGRLFIPVDSIKRIEPIAKPD